MQIAKKFDRVTLMKIGKGALIAAGAPAAIGLLGFFGTLQISNPTLAMIVAWLCPVLINAIKEWMTGRKSDPK